MYICVTAVDKKIAEFTQIVMPIVDGYHKISTNYCLSNPWGVLKMSTVIPSLEIYKNESISLEHHVTLGNGL